MDHATGNARTGVRPRKEILPAVAFNPVQQDRRMKKPGKFSSQLESTLATDTFSEPQNSTQPPICLQLQRDGNPSESPPK